MASREALLRAGMEKTCDEISADVTITDEQKEDNPPPIHAITTDHSTLRVPVENYEEVDMGVRNGVDTEKQGLVGNDYRGISPEASDYLLHILTTRLLAIAVGVVLFIGIVSAVRAVGRIQAWRTC